MIELMYLSLKTINLEDIQKIAEEMGFPIYHLPPPMDVLQIYTDEDGSIVCLWEVVEGNDLEIVREAYEKFEKELISLDKAVSIHRLSFHLETTSYVKKILHNIFLKFEGWAIDDVTPNFYPSTRGQVRKYTLANIDEFLKPPGE